MSPEITDAVEALLEQRQDQGFDAPPPENVTEALSRIVASVQEVDR